MVLNKMPSTAVTMSRGFTAAIFQDLVMGHVLDIQSKSNAAVAGPPGGGAQNGPQRHLFFIDDLNMAPSVGSKFLMKCCDFLMFEVSLAF